MSTRLPPKGNRKGGKQSKAGRRKLVEMENAGKSASNLGCLYFVAFATTLLTKVTSPLYLPNQFITERERINNEIKKRSSKLIEVLSSGGVSDESIQVLKDSLTINEDGDTPQELDDTIFSLTQVDDALKKAWSFASCYPGIEVSTLISTLDQLRSLVSDKATLSRKPIRRKLDDISMNPKADPELLEGIQKEEEKISSTVTQMNIGAYKTGALVAVAHLG